MSEPAEPRLTLKQQAFVEHITSPETFGNGTQAAIKAGYSSNGNYPRVAAHRAITNANVQKAIQKRLAPIMDANECLEELSSVARVQPTKKSALNGNHKLKALELVGKAHNLFGENNQQNQLQEVANIIQSLSNFGINPDAVAGRVADEIERREREANTVDMPE